jgi:hypothetical protein
LGLLVEAAKKYETTIELQPSFHGPLNNWAKVLGEKMNEKTNEQKKKKSNKQTNKMNNANKASKTKETKQNINE